MRRDVHKNIGIKTGRLFQCEKCKQQVTRRQSRAINALQDGTVTGHNEGKAPYLAAKTGEKGNSRQVTRKNASKRVCRNCG